MKSKYSILGVILLITAVLFVPQGQVLGQEGRDATSIQYPLGDGTFSLLLLIPDDDPGDPKRLVRLSEENFFLSNEAQLFTTGDENGYFEAVVPNNAFSAFSFALFEFDEATSMAGAEIVSPNPPVGLSLVVPADVDVNNVKLMRYDYDVAGQEIALTLDSSGQLLAQLDNTGTFFIVVDQPEYQWQKRNDTTSATQGGRETVIPTGLPNTGFPQSMPVEMYVLVTLGLIAVGGIVWVRFR